MGRSYQNELSELPETYAATRAVGLTEGIRAALDANRPMVFVGSGGALAAARLAADLHMYSTGHLAAAMTPLEASTARLRSTTGLVLFTARGRNPDAKLAIKAARLRGAEHMAVISATPRNALPPVLAQGDVTVGKVSASRDGFLATNSLLAMTAATCLVHGAGLPTTLPGFSITHQAVRRSVIAVTGPGSLTIGLDLEARLVETGLATVQISDYRNLAHGRHVGLSRNIGEMTIVATIDPRSREIASRTFKILPARFEVIELRSDLEWPVSVLDQLVASMHLVGSTATNRGIDPGRPRVPEFGRRLYRTSVRRYIPISVSHPVEKKVGRYGMRTKQTWSKYNDALNNWLTYMSRVDIGSIVLDYDGTVCSTLERAAPPRLEVQEGILRLLDGGIALSFATGRGKSLHHTTRAWLPERYWRHILVGLYNGSLLLRLDEDPPVSTGCDGYLAEAAKRLESVASAWSLQIEPRRTQVSVLNDGGTVDGRTLLPIVRSILERSPRLPLKTAASAHSVDILNNDASKRTVVTTVANASSGHTLAIGDQGQVNGNDFELLSYVRTSLSVDRCSEDPTRCWNLDTRGDSGPDLLIRYLRAVEPRASGGRFSWSIR